MREKTERRLRVLILEDDERGAALIQKLLDADDLSCDLVRVEKRQDFVAALEQDAFDLILSDYRLPCFDGASALQIARQAHPDVPFIIVSGTLGEEPAIELLRQGATDYVLKDALSRLPMAVRRALRDSEGRRQRQLAEEQIREQAALLDQANDSIMVCNTECRVVFWNRSAELLFGWAASDASGRHLFELLRVKDGFRGEEACGSVFAKGEWEGELDCRTKDGREVMVASRWTLVRDNVGAPRSILLIITDITEKKKSEMQLLSHQRLESIGILAGGIAHDLNNALAPILMSVQLLRMKFTDAESQQLLGVVEASAQRGADMVKQVLTFARGVEGQRVELHLKYLMQEIAQIIQGTFPKTILIEFGIPKGVWNLTGDAIQLQQVLLNLCVNAREAMPEGGRLTISAENVHLDENYARLRPEGKSGPHVLITVADTGTGIAGEIMDKIFEPFFTTKGVGKGTGLGLATARGIVKSHGGFISVESEPGKGSRFKVHLPAVRGVQTRQAEQAQRELPSGHDELVLVVDDEAAVREITQATLQNNGYRVLTASDGTEAISLYAQQKSDIKLVPTDMVMPVFDGNATIRALRKLDPTVKIIVSSGLMDKKDESEAMKLGVNKILVKPYTAATLLSAVRQVLGQS